MPKVVTYQRLSDLPLAYQALFAKRTACTDIFQTLPWFENLVACALEKNPDLRIYGVESACEPFSASAILPMHHPTSAGGLFAPRRLTALSTFYSVLFCPIVDEEIFSSAPALQLTLRLLVNTIATERPRWDLVDLHPLAADSPIFDGLLVAFRNAGMAVQRYFCFGNWYLDVRGRTFEQYFDGLPSKLRNTLKRKSAPLEASNRLRIDICLSSDGLEKGIVAYGEIYNSSWKNPETYPEFIPGLLRTCAEHGWLRLGIAYIDEQPAAAQIWLVYNGVASIYKLAYDQRFSTFSVGTILTARMMQRAIDVDQVREVDYLSGDDTYKQDWMSHRRERVGLIAFNLRTVRGILAACRHIGGRAFKNIIRPHSSE